MWKLELLGGPSLSHTLYQKSRSFFLKTGRFFPFPADMIKLGGCCSG